MENQEQKETYQKRFQDQLDEWRADIDRLRERAKSASAETKLKYDEQIDKLEIKLEEGRARLNDLKESGADVWDSVKDGAESIWDTMKATFAEVKDKLSEKEDGKND